MLHSLLEKGNRQREEAERYHEDRRNPPPRYFGGYQREVHGEARFTSGFKPPLWVLLHELVGELWLHPIPLPNIPLTFPTMA